MYNARQSNYLPHMENLVKVKKKVNCLKRLKNNY